MNKKVCKVIFWVSVSMSLIFAFLLIMTLAKSWQTENNTVRYDAKVERVEVISGEQIFVRILPQEYGTFLYVAVNSLENLNAYRIKELQKGQQITFRISQIWNRESLDFSTLTPIESLSVDGEEVFSLNDYNVFTQENNRSVVVKFICLLSVSLLLFALSLYMLLVNKKKQH